MSLMASSSELTYTMNIFNKFSNEITVHLKGMNNLHDSHNGPKCFLCHDFHGMIHVYQNLRSSECSSRLYMEVNHILIQE
jgi:hypothetical protein